MGYHWSMSICCSSLCSFINFLPSLSSRVERLELKVAELVARISTVDQEPSTGLSPLQFPLENVINSSIHQPLVPRTGTGKILPTPPTVPSWCSNPTSEGCAPTYRSIQPAIELQAQKSTTSMQVQEPSIMSFPLPPSSAPLEDINIHQPLVPQQNYGTGTATAEFSTSMLHQKSSPGLSRLHSPPSSAPLGDVHCTSIHEPDQESSTGLSLSQFPLGNVIKSSIHQPLVQWTGTGKTLPSSPPTVPSWCSNPTSVGCVPTYHTIEPTIETPFFLSFSSGMGAGCWQIDHFKFIGL
jgi:hypothetical protein